MCKLSVPTAIRQVELTPWWSLVVVGKIGPGSRDTDDPRRDSCNQQSAVNREYNPIDVRSGIARQKDDDRGALAQFTRATSGYSGDHY